MRSIAFFQISVSTGSLRLRGFNCKLMAWKFGSFAIENPSVAIVASLFWRFGPHICTRQSIRIFRTMSGRPNAIQGKSCQWRWGSLLNLKMISGGCEGFAFVCVVEAWRMSSWGWDSVVAAVICVLISHLNNGATCLDKAGKLCVGCKGEGGDLRIYDMIGRNGSIYVIIDRAPTPHRASVMDLRTWSQGTSGIILYNLRRVWNEVEIYSIL